MHRTGIIRAAAALGFAMLAFLGSCKKTPRALKDGDRLSSYSQQITAPVKDFGVKAGETYQLDIKVKNTGTQPWFAGGAAGRVDASYRWLDAHGKMLPIEGARASLTRLHVMPGESDELLLPAAAPPAPGSYTLWVSMVQEGFDWFYARGAAPLVLKVTVR